MELPEACVANILSFTSPADIFSSSSVSSVFRSAGDSDFVWEKFLPSDYAWILSRSNEQHRNFSSRKEIFRCLCESILIDNSRKLFKIEKFSGKISYVLSARDISITWSDQPTYWCWKHISDSRFPESVELITTDWLEINGKIQTRMLSANTRYGAYLILKVTSRAYGLELLPAETSVITTKSGQIHKSTSYLCCLDDKKQQMNRLVYGNREERMAMAVEPVRGDEKRREPEGRDNGWMEIELGEFESCGDDEVNMSLKEVKGYQLKGGIVIDGIEIRPKSLN